MSRVIFSEELDKNELKQELEAVFDPGDKVAVKLHMGEPGNSYAFRPEDVKVYVETLKQIGAEPFLFDSPVIYSGPRHTSEGYQKVAEKKGFAEIAPVVISNDSFVEKGLIDYGVCTPPVEADGVLILTHVKGHPCSGFGGAIKNLGMGALTKETKGKIHSGGEPIYTEGCTQCGECVARCPNDHVRIEKRPYFDQNWCCGCSNCAIFCPENAIKTKIATFDKLLAEGAHMAEKNYKKTYYVNVIKNLTKLCDCVSDPGEPVMGDVGFVMGRDIVSVEKASLDKINEKAGEDVFREIHHKSPLKHIKEAQKLGMGELEYELG